MTGIQSPLPSNVTTLFPGMVYVKMVPFELSASGVWDARDAEAEVTHGVTFERSEVIPLSANG